MTKRSFILLVLFAGFSAFSLYRIALAHTPSPSVCNDPYCNIDLSGLSFAPSYITVRPPNPDTGEYVTIMWENHDSVTHTVTSGPRGSPDGIFRYTNLGPGSSFIVEIDQARYDQLLAEYGQNGEIPYHCEIHPGMNATLKIAGDPIPEFSLSTLILVLALAFSVLVLMKKRTRLL